MFASKSLALLLVALVASSFAVSPLAFIKGFNSELGLEDDAAINECLARSVKNVDDESTVCIEAMDSYISALYVASFESAEGQTLETVSIETVGAAFRAVGDFSEEMNFDAGQETAQMLKQLAVVLRMVSHERKLAGANVTVNATEFILGLNDQLAVTAQQGLELCLNDSDQTEVLVQALLEALKSNDFAEAIAEIIKLVKYLPGIKTTCATSVQGVATFAKPIEKSLLANSTEFFQLINTNLNKNPFAVAAESLEVMNDLKVGKDYNAGVTSGKLVQIALKGIIN